MNYDEMAGWVNANTPFMTYSGIHIEKVWRDGAIAKAAVTANTMNPYHMAHGGLLFTMADVCAGTAARSDGRSYVTQQSSVSFLKPGREGDELTAEARVINRGRTVCLIESDVRSADGRLLFTGMFTYFCISEESSDKTREKTAGPAGAGN